MGKDRSIEFLNVDFGKDWTKASRFAQRILTEILRLPEETTLYARLENGTPEDRLVDR